MLPLVDKCVQLIHIILQMIPESVFWDRRTSKVPEAGEKLSTQQQTKEFNNGMDILEYTHEFYGIRPNNTHESITKQNGTSTTNINNNNDTNTSNNNKDEGDIKVIKESEDEGDLSIAHTSSSSGTYDGLAGGLTTHILANRPQYGPIRGSILIAEVMHQLTHFLSGLVSSYIIPPEKDSIGGVDVGVDGKRLRSIDSQLEKVLHSVCSALTLIAKHADERFSWDNNDQDQLTRTLLMCCENGREFGVLDAGLSTLTQLMRRRPFIKEGALKRRTVSKHIMDNVCNIYLSLCFLFVCVCVCIYICLYAIYHKQKRDLV